MGSTRREFIRQIGIVLASAMMAGCTGSGGASQPAPTSTSAPTPTSASVLTPTPECAPFEAEGNSSRERLRHCWISLDWLARQAENGYECGDQARAQLESAHRVVLDDLVEDEELQADVGEYMQSAFDEAVYHIWRSHAPITCYEVAGPFYHPESRGKLIQKANHLAEIAASGNVDPETVAQAQAAMERDMAFLGLSEPELEALYDGLATTGGNYPPFDEIELEVTPEAAQAAAYLVQLLSGR
jgi:hypothetical protein